MLAAQPSASLSRTENLDRFTVLPGGSDSLFGPEPE
jgi:hypothetical protein